MPRSQPGFSNSQEVIFDAKIGSVFNSVLTSEGLPGPEHPRLPHCLIASNLARRVI